MSRHRNHGSDGMLNGWLPVCRASVGWTIGRRAAVCPAIAGNSRLTELRIRPGSGSFSVAVVITCRLW